MPLTDRELELPPPGTVYGCACGLGVLMARRTSFGGLMWWCGICRRLYRLRRRGDGALEQY